MFSLVVCATLFFPLQAMKNNFKSAVLIDKEGILKPVAESNGQQTETDAINKWKANASADEYLQERTKPFAAFHGKNPTLTLFSYDNLLVPTEALLQLYYEFQDGPGYDAGKSEDAHSLWGWYSNTSNYGMLAKTGQQIWQQFDAKLTNLLTKARLGSDGIVAIISNNAQWFVDSLVNKDFLPQTAALLAEHPEIVLLSSQNVLPESLQYEVRLSRWKEIFLPRLLQACQKHVGPIRRLIAFAGNAGDMQAAKAVEAQLTESKQLNVKKGAQVPGAERVVTSVKFSPTDPQHLLVFLDVMAKMLEDAAVRNVLPSHAFSSVEMLPSLTHSEILSTHVDSSSSPSSYSYSMGQTGQLRFSEYRFRE